MSERVTEYTVTPRGYCQQADPRLIMYFKGLQYFRFPLKYMLFILLY